MVKNTVVRLTTLYGYIHCLMQFKFIVEEDAALPVDSTFWDYLMGSSQTQWGLTVYEQDWLFSEYMKIKALQVSLPIYYIAYT